MSGQSLFTEHDCTAYGKHQKLLIDAISLPAVKGNETQRCNASDVYHWMFGVGLFEKVIIDKRHWVSVGVVLFYLHG